VYLILRALETILIKSQLKASLMRKIACRHIVGPDEQTSLSDLNDMIEKLGVSEQDVISVQHVYYPCISPSDRNPDKVNVYTYIFFWSD